MPPLWKPESWASRLAELEARTGDLKEAPLRRDVRSLGTLLGDVLREQAGDPLTPRWKSCGRARSGGARRRRAAMAMRPNADGAMASARPADSRPVERLSCEPRLRLYFELINLAETNHRKRRRLSSQVSGEARAQRGTLRGTLCAMRRVGIQAEEALGWLRQVLDRAGIHRAPYGGGAALGDVQAAADRGPAGAARSHPDARGRAGTVAAELMLPRSPRSGRRTRCGAAGRRSTTRSTWGSTTTTLRSSRRCPALYREIADALPASYGLEIEAADLPLVLQFGSWIGGDRDGNPFVTPEVTREAIQLARGHLLA